MHVRGRYGGATMYEYFMKRLGLPIRHSTSRIGVRDANIASRALEQASLSGARRGR